MRHQVKPSDSMQNRPTWRAGRAVESWCGKLLHETLINHGIRHLHKAGDVGAGYIVGEV